MATGAQTMYLNIHFIDIVNSELVYVHPRFSLDEIGANLSDYKNINLNPVSNKNGRPEYSIVYRLIDLTELNFDSFTRSLVKIFGSNFPTSNLCVKIWAPLDIDSNINDNDRINYSYLIQSLAEEIDDAELPGDNVISIYIHDGIYDRESINPDDDEDDDEDDGYQRLGDDSYHDSHHGDETYEQLRALGLIDDDDDEDDDEDDYPSQKRRYSRSSQDDYIDQVLSGYLGSDYKDKGHIRPSKVLKAAKDPKKSYHRHGLVICSSKSALEKDRATIKKFLKEFIPGNSEWRKSLRRSLLSRWMKMYTITNKKMKALDREYQKSRKKKSSSFNANRALAYSRSFFNIPSDNWNDPSK